MGWNYRIIKETLTGPDGDTADCYGIHEVYYDPDGKPTGWSDAIQPYGETLDDLKTDMSLMMQAFEKPVLDMVVLMSSAKNDG